MATTRNNAFKSPPPRLPQEGPSHFLQKLDPWFVGFAQLFKEDVLPKVDAPKRVRRAGHVGQGMHSQPTKSPPPAVLPGWPRTVGEMLSLLARSGDPRLAEAMRVVQQR